jgi:hypothetical protein
MLTSPIVGSCLCSGVAFEVTQDPISFHYCTCKSCQKTTGSAHASNFTVDLDEFAWTRGEKLISKFTDSNENPGFPTWFCSCCGSFLPHINRFGNVYVVPAGLLDSPVDWKPKKVIYWDECPEWYLPVTELRKKSEG